MLTFFDKIGHFSGSFLRLIDGPNLDSPDSMVVVFTGIPHGCVKAFEQNDVRRHFIRHIVHYILCDILYWDLS